MNRNTSTSEIRTSSILSGVITPFVFAAAIVIERFAVYGAGALPRRWPAQFDSVLFALISSLFYTPLFLRHFRRCQIQVRVMRSFGIALGASIILLVIEGISIQMQLPFLLSMLLPGVCVGFFVYQILKIDFMKLPTGNPDESP